MGVPSATFPRASYSYQEAERLLVGLGVPPDHLKHSHKPGMILAFCDGCWGAWSLDGDGLDKLLTARGLVTASTAAAIEAIEAMPADPLPRFCYIATGWLERENERATLALVFKGEPGAREKGSYPTYKIARERARELNKLLGVSPAQATAMEVGAFEGWNHPWVDPSRYDGAGKPIRGR